MILHYDAQSDMMEDVIWVAEDAAEELDPDSSLGVVEGTHGSGSAVLLEERAAKHTVPFAVWHERKVPLLRNPEVRWHRTGTIARR